MAESTVFDLASLWDESLHDLTTTITSPAQRRWLSATRPVGFSHDTVVLAAPHTFAREWLDVRCGDQLREALSRAAGRQLHVVITVKPNPAPLETDLSEGGSSVVPSSVPSSRGNIHHAQTNLPSHLPAEVIAPGPRQDSADNSPTVVSPPTNTPSTVSHGDDGTEPATTVYESQPPASLLESTNLRPLEAPGRPPGPVADIPSKAQHPSEEDPSQLNPKYVFDRFVIGPSNRFAHAAAFAVAEAPARAYNPLFIYGGAGLGKTHLLHAIGHYVRSLYTRLRVHYLTTEQFTNEFINAIRDDRVTAFQRKYRHADVVLIDDIQFLESKERTQEEFFHTFNSLHNAEKQIVISSDRPPKQIARLEDRLRSRFEWGLMTDIQPPDLETRIAILKKKANYEDLQVPGEVLYLIASKVQSNIRELEGALIRVTAFASLQRTEVDPSLAEMVLKDLFPNETNREIGLQLIQEEVSAFFELSVEDLCSPSRSRQLVTARQIAMYLVRELTDLSLPRIGKAFGGRDHTTVMHATSKIADLMQERRTIYNQIQELTSRIRARSRTG
ncbi:MAG: chromosomal replication initiator protein DnaA [Nitriliruptorales bacterium]